MKKKIILLTMSFALLFLLTACSSTDIVGNQSIKSFDAVLKAIPNNIASDEKNGSWALTSPDGTERFLWSKDFSQGTSRDVMLELNAKPFIDAGLDTSKLPTGMFVNDKIMVGTNLGDEKITYNGEATPLDSYKKIVELKRDHIKYHTELDHYGVDLGDGNVFEWAKDMGTNDKDIVFALNPETFIKAGVNPKKVDGWLFAKVKIMDKNGKKIEVDKFLKPFNLQ